jgi:hypothetical protein
VSIAVQPIPMMACAGSRGTIQAAINAAQVPSMVSGRNWTPTWIRESCRRLIMNMVQYQRKIPRDMKAKNMTSMSRPKDGARHMLNGRIGDEAILAS